MEQYAEVVLDLAGNAVQGASVQVLVGSVNGALATIYDAGGTPQQNPVITGLLGEFAFQVANGKYVLRVLVNGTPYRTVGPLTFYDPNDDTGRVTVDSVNAAVAGAVPGAVASAIPSVLGGSDGATKVGTPLGNVAKRLQSLPISWLDVGAVGNGVNNDAPAVLSTIDDRHVRIPKGTYRLNTGVDFQPWPVTIEGDPSGTVIVVADADNKFGFRFGASGYATPDGVDGRQITSVSGVTFIGKGMTGIRVQIVHPFFANLVRFNGMGYTALEMFQQYYGRMQNFVFRDSGVFLTNVNNFSFDGGDCAGIADSPNYGPTDYTNLLVDCDGVSFHNETFEGHRNRVFRIVDSKNISYNNCWLEANTADEVYRLEQTTATSYNDCFLELYPSPSSTFIRVDNNAVFGVSRKLVSNIVVRGGHLRLNTDEAVAPAFVDATAGSKAAVVIDGATIDSGHLFVRGDVVLDVSRVTLSSATDTIDQVKSLHSTPNAQLLKRYNSWVPESVQSDWDFATGHGLTEVGTAALTFSTTLSDVEVMTGTRAIKVAGIPSNATRYVIEKAMPDMGAVTVEGQTHLIFVRFKTSADMSIIFSVEGFFIEYEHAPNIVCKGGRWHDFVLKTSSDFTWNQGRQGFPKLHMKVNNSSGSVGNMIIDRIDYQTVQGDVYLP